MTKPTRRTLLTAAAGLPAAMAVPAAALGESADAELLALWPRYVAAYRACCNISDAVASVAGGELSRITRQIFAQQPQTLSGAGVWLRVVLTSKECLMKETDALLSGRPVVIDPDSADYDLFDRAVIALAQGHVVTVPSATSSVVPDMAVAVAAAEWEAARRAGMSADNADDDSCDAAWEAETRAGERLAALPAATPKGAALQLRWLVTKLHEGILPIEAEGLLSRLIASLNRMPGALA